MRTRFSFLPAVAGAIALAGLGLGLAACGDDDDGGGDDEAAIQASIDAINKASLDGDVSTIENVLTDDGAAAIFFGSTIEDIKADPSIIAVESEDDFFVAEEIEVDGDTAEAIGGFPGQGEESFLVAGTVVKFVKDGDNWKADGLGVADAEEPADAVTVAFTMDDFSFEFDADALEVGKPILFEAVNDGEQLHEMVLVRLEEGVVLEEALQSEGEPEGVEFLGFAGLFAAGEDADVAYTAPLEAGRYAFVCFLPDTSKENPEEQVPHAFLGMTSEFEVE